MLPHRVCFGYGDINIIISQYAEYIIGYFNSTKIISIATRGVKCKRRSFDVGSIGQNESTSGLKKETTIF